MKKILGLGILGSLVFLWALRTGGVSLGWADWGSPLFISLRLPRVLIAGTVGALLASSGAALQGLFRNPLADPYLVGVSSGAALGAVAALVLKIPAPALAASVGAFITLAAVISLARVGGTVDMSLLVLAGVAVHSFTSAVLTFILSQVSGRYETTGIFFWLLGSLDTLSYKTLLPLMAASAAGLFLLVLHGPALNLLAQGEETARTLGLSVDRAKWSLLLLCAGLTGLGVTFNGMIPFVGLIVPHAARFFVGADHRRVLPLSAFLGAVLVVAADALGRTLLSPQEIPTGVMTALGGAPFFLYLLRRSRRAYGAPSRPPHRSHGREGADNSTHATDGAADAWISVKAPAAKAGVAIKASKASFRYSSAGFSLENISLDLKPGEVLGILGPNGGGKSTLLRLLCGVVKPVSGEILIDGKSPAAWGAREMARRVALVPQESDSIFPSTVREAVGLGFFPRSGKWGWSFPPDKELEEILRVTDIWNLRDKPLSRLSGGERRRTWLARALAQDPKILLLDEPTAHLDPRHQWEFLELVDRLRRERGVAVAAVLHDVNLVLSWCPAVLCLKNGRPAAWGPTEEVVTPDILEFLFGLRAEIRGENGFRSARFLSLSR